MTEGNGDIRELPKGWTWTRLGNLGKIVAGGTPSTKNEEYWGNEVFWVSPADLSGYKRKFISRGRKSLSKLGLENSSAKLMSAGSILFSSRAPIGYVVISANEICTNQGFKSLVPSKEIFNEYIYYYLKASKQLAEKYASGTTFKELSGKSFSILPIPLPPHKEQKRIVERIEELFSDIDQGVESLKTAQKQLKVYRQAVLKWAFEGKLTEAWRKQRDPSTIKTGEALLTQIKAERENRDRQQLAEWEAKVREWEAIGKVGKKPQKPQKYKDPSPIPKAQISGSPSIPESWFWTNLEQLKEFSLYGPRFSSQDYVDDGIPIARTTDINSSGKVDLKYAPKISLSDQEFEKYKLIKGDLLLTRTGSIGTNAVFHASEKAIPGAFLIHYRLLPSLNIWFIFYFLESPKAQQHFFERSSGVGRPNLNVPSIEELMIPLPSLEEQEEIVQEIESRLSICDQLEATIIENLQKAEALRQSILKQAFEGKLVPQDPNDEPAEKLLEQIRLERQEKRSPQTPKQLKIKGI